MNSRSIVHHAVLMAITLSPALSQAPDPATDGSLPLPGASSTAPFGAATRLIAVIRPVGKGTMTGRVEFVAGTSGVRLIATIAGLQPGASHTLRIHEFGDLSSEDASSAGGPFPTESSPAGGTLEHQTSAWLLRADPKGQATLELELPGINLGHGPKGLLGRSVIIHAPPGIPRPVAQRGGRVGAGVIGLSMSQVPGIDAVPPLPK